MGMRKNQATLTGSEKARFVAAVLQLKANRIYDQYVAAHREAMNSPQMPAHGGSAFLPWHREFLRRFELDLQRIDSSVTIPYWDWTVDRSPASSLWRPDFMGGDGEPGSLRVTTGPFAFNTGRWNISVGSSGDPGPALRRALGQDATLPRAAEVSAVLARTPYDRSPWMGSTQSFRSELEIIVHNVVHRWVGGSMGTATSPNDPVFFLHHAYVDLLWARWQNQHPGERFYLPMTGGMQGHNLNDPMSPWGGTTTPASVLNHRTLGYSYDDEVPQTPVARELIVGAAPYQDAIERSGKINLYSFVAPATGTYKIETTGSTDTFMTLLGPDSQSRFIMEDDDSGAGANSRIAANLATGVYFVRVRHYNSNGRGSYRIAVTA